MKKGKATERASAAIIGFTVGAAVFAVTSLALGAGWSAVASAGAAWAFLALTFWIVAMIADGGGKR